MDDDLDIEAMLEAPYEKEKRKEKPSDKGGDGDDSANSDEDYSRHKKSKKRRSRSRSPKVSSRSRRSRSRSPERRKRRSRSRSRDRDNRKPRRRDSSRDRNPRRNRRSRSRSPRRGGRRGGSDSPDGRNEKDKSGRPLLLSERKDRQPYYISTMSEKRGGGRHVQVISLLSDRERELEDENVSQEERDARTVFVMQLARNVTIRDIEEFFSKVGQVRDVRLISDKNSRRSKGIGYVEFTDASSVPLAINLSGQKLLGVPIMCQPTMAEKNRVAAAAAAFSSKPSGPTRLYVGSLHYNISEQMLTAIFEPFGLLDSVQLQYDSETKRSKGYGFVTYKDADSAKRAMDQLNGLEVAGRAMKVGNVTERSDGSMSFLDDEETEKGGIEMNAASRAALMQKLAATHAVGMNVPSAPMIPGLITQPMVPTAVIPSTSLLLSNMFDPSKEHDPDWDEDIKGDVLEEVSKIGNIVHIHVDRASPDGNVYMKCSTPEAASLVVQTFNGRWFAGRTLNAALLPLATYHGIFPASVAASVPLR